jgi:hypothetical protein
LLAAPHLLIVERPQLRVDLSLRLVPLLANLIEIEPDGRDCGTRFPG